VALTLSVCRFSGGSLPDGVTLEGNAWMDADFGVKVDGEGDGIALGTTSAEGWSGDDDFTISFAFTKGHCRIPGEYEFLFSSCKFTSNLPLLVISRLFLTDCLWL